MVSQREELLFRGLLLPRMRKSCGRFDWLGIIAHSGQSVFLSLLVLGIVLGYG